MDAQIGYLTLYLTHLTPWSVVVGTAAYGLACASLAVICAFGLRTVRASLTAVYVVVMATGYAGSALSTVSGVLGDRFRMPALTYACYEEPWLVFAPPWMVGGTIYSIRSQFVGEWIIPITAAVFVVAALVLCAASYVTVARARGGSWTDVRTD